MALERDTLHWATIDSHSPGKNHTVTFFSHREGAAMPSLRMAARMLVMPQVVQHPLGDQQPGLSISEIVSTLYQDYVSP